MSVYLCWCFTMRKWLYALWDHCWFSGSLCSNVIQGSGFNSPSVQLIEKKVCYPILGYNLAFKLLFWLPVKSVMTCYTTLWKYFFGISLLVTSVHVTHESCTTVSSAVCMLALDAILHNYRWIALFKPLSKTNIGFDSYCRFFKS